MHNPFQLRIDHFDCRRQGSVAIERKLNMASASRLKAIFSVAVAQWRKSIGLADCPLNSGRIGETDDRIEAHGIPFHPVPVTPETKQKAYREMERLFREAQADLIVLARYMQVLDEPMCREFAGRIINIHHSFLPSFAGAKPYHQAHRRGVKLIGATCHFVTPELDEGPIVEQDVIRIDHSDTPDDMAHLGKDIEKVVLARGLRAVVEDRVLLAGNKTVIFR